MWITVIVGIENKRATVLIISAQRDPIAATFKDRFRIQIELVGFGVTPVIFDRARDASRDVIAVALFPFLRVGDIQLIESQIIGIFQHHLTIHHH